MKNKKTLQLFILALIFFSMIAIIFVSSQLIGGSNEQSYKPTNKSLKIKAAPKTYTRLLALNNAISPTPSPSLTPTLTANNAISPTTSPSLTPTLTAVLTPETTVDPSLSETLPESATPTEIILAKADTSPTIAQADKEVLPNASGTIPKSGYYQAVIFLVGLSLLTIFFSFIF
jgi:hypothetical protein